MKYRDMCWADVCGRIEANDVNIDVALGYLNHMICSIEDNESVRKIYHMAYEALGREKTCNNIYKGVLGFECSNCHYTEKISVCCNYCPSCGRKVEERK